MVWDTYSAYAGGLGPPHQMPDSLLHTETGVEDDGAGVRRAVLGVPGGWHRPCGPCRPPYLWGLRWLASHRNQDRPPEGCIATRSNKGMEQTNGAMAEMAAPLAAHPQRVRLRI